MKNHVLTVPRWLSDAVDGCWPDGSITDSQRQDYVETLLAVTLTSARTHSLFSGLGIDEFVPGALVTEAGELTSRVNADADLVLRLLLCAAVAKRLQVRNRELTEEIEYLRWKIRGLEDFNA